MNSMPGITVKNRRYIMDALPNLAALGSVTLEQLKGLIGEEAGKKLIAFVKKRG